MTEEEGEQRPLSLARAALDLFGDYQRDGDLPLLSRAVRGFRAALAAAVGAGAPEVAAYHNNLGYALHELAAASGDPAAQAEAVGCHRAAVAAAGPGHQGRAGYLCTLSSGLRDLYKASGDPDLLREAVAAAREAIDSPCADQPSPAVQFAVLAGALGDLYDYQADDAVLASLIDAYRTAAEFAEILDDPGLPAHWRSLGAWLRARYERTGDVGALAESILLCRKAVAATSGDQYFGCLSDLGDTLRLRFERTGDPDALTEAIAAHRLIVAGTWPGHPDLPRRASNRSGALIVWYQRTGDVAALAEAIAAARQAVAAAPPGDTERGGHLNNLHVALELEYERTGTLAALSESVRVAREAAAAVPPGHHLRALCQTGLANAVRTFYDRTGDDRLLAECVQASRDALAAIPVGGPDRAAALLNLGQALAALSGRTGDRGALDEAVRVTREAIAVTSPDAPALAKQWGALSSLLDDALSLTGDAELLAEAVAAARAAVAAVPADHPDRAMLLDDLGAALTSQFIHTRNSAVLAEAVQVREEALAATPDGHTSRVAALVNLANSVQTLASRTGDARAAVEAARLTAEAADALPEDHPGRPLCLHRLAAIYRDQHRRFQEPELLDNAIRCARESLALTPEDHASHAGRVATLGGLLLDQSAGGKDQALVAEALRLARQALAATAPHDPGYGSRLNLLGWALYTRHLAAAREGGDAAAVAEAWECMYAAAHHPLAPARLRINAYRRAAELAPVVGRTAGEALACIEAAVDLLPAVLPGRLDRTDQEYEIGLVTHLAAHAAEAAVSAGRPDRAVELLERTRGVLVAAELDRRAGHDHSAPLTISALGAIANDGPVAYLSPGVLRCDALVLIPAVDSAATARVRHVPLAVTPADVEDKARRLLTLVGLQPDDEEHDPADPAAGREALAILGWIREHVTGPVLAALDYDRPSADVPGPPRIWWCPVGDFTYLPLHAACLDEVVSSYTFTARSLRYARSQPPPEAGAASAPLIVAVPDAPGTPRLPGADREAQLIAGILPGAVRLAPPTRNVVLSALPEHPVAHFACHGAVNPDEPGRSQLFLDDHAAAPLTVSDIGALRLAGGLAFLSACETAVTNGNLANEAVHLAGAFHLAGYQHVVGTLWPVSDLASTALVREFYSTLTGPGSRSVVDTGRTAMALNHATRRLRDRYPGWPMLWAGHVHVGP